MSSYAQLKKEFKLAEVFEPEHHLSLQGGYARFLLVFGISLISLALVSSSLQKGFLPRLIIFIIAGILGCAFSSQGILFLADSLGVYI